MIKWGLFQVCKIGSQFEKSINVIHLNRLKKKNHMILIDTNQEFNKIEHPFMMTSLGTVGT